MALNLRDFLDAQGIRSELGGWQSQVGRVIIKDGIPYIYFNGTFVDLRKCAFTNISTNAMYGGEELTLQLEARLADNALSYGGIATDDFDRITPQDRGKFAIKRVHYKKQDYHDGLRCIWNEI